MSISINYSQYLKKIEKFKNALKNNSWNSTVFYTKLSEISKILEIRGISACNDLLDNELIENLDRSFDEYSEYKQQFFCDIFSTLYFKGKCSGKLRKIYLPLYYSSKEERKPTKRESLYDKIITLYSYEYNNYKSNTIDKKYFINNFPQKLNEIKNLYSKMLKEGVDDDLHKYDQFDKDFFNRYIKFLDDINKEILEEINREIKNKRRMKNLNSVKGIPLKKRTFFYDKEKLVYGEDIQIEYKNYSFPFNEHHKDEIKKQICAFLNSKGGRIFIGITDDKIINGIILDDHEKDKNTNEIVNLTYYFYPKCRTYIDVSFIPIKNDENEYIKNKYVIKIIVSQGETNQLYSYTTKGFNSYLRLKGQCINLTAEEIRNEIIKREKSPQNKNNPNEFKDPEPDNPKLNINIPPKPFVFQKKNDSPYNNKTFQNYKTQTKEKSDVKEPVNVENSDDDEYDEEEDEEYDEDEDLEESEESYVPPLGNTQKEKQNGCNQNKGGINSGNKGQSESKNQNKYTIKVYITRKKGKMPTYKELRLIFNNFNNCKKKFIIMNGRAYGFLNFSNMKEAILFLQTFNYNINPNYEFCLIRRF